MRVALVAVAACGSSHTIAPAKDAPLDLPADVAFVDSPLDAFVPIAQPRLIAPLSSTMTGLSPKLRWTLDTGSGIPSVELCTDRACTNAISTAVTYGAGNVSAVPTTPLPRGPVFWRVRVTLGTQSVTTPTWELFAGTATASGTVFDVNGDGYGDFLVGAEDANSNTGAAHVFLGSASPSATRWNGSGATDRIDLVAPETGTAYFGFSVAPLGDVDGDGYSDFAIGAYAASSEVGAAHVYYGGTTDWNGTSPAARFDLAGIDGAVGDYGVVAPAGDVNGDGYADFIVGAFGGGGNAHLYLGSPTRGSFTRLDLTNPDGAGAQFGISACALGDIDADGHDDFLIGAFNASTNTGKVHIYVGSSAPDATAWNAGTGRTDVSSPDGNGGEFGNQCGRLDIDGDGHPDYVVSAFRSTTNAANVFRGSGARIDVPVPAGSEFTAAAAGDVDGDGFGDFLVGAHIGDHAYLYFGGASPASQQQALANPDATGANFGYAVASAGDVDGDGLADFLVGAYSASSGAGAVHLYLGSATRAFTRIDLTDPDGTGAYFGAAVAGAR
jgi:hypothetical protein